MQKPQECRVLPKGTFVFTRFVQMPLFKLHNKTKILKLPEAKTKDYGGFYESSYWYTEGGEMYNFMTYAYAGENRPLYTREFMLLDRWLYVDKRYQ